MPETVVERCEAAQPGSKNGGANGTAPHTVTGPNGAGSYAPNRPNGGHGPNGSNGGHGPNGSNGGHGPNGSNAGHGPNGSNGHGPNGSNGSNGHGPNGSNGANGSNGGHGPNGSNGSSNGGHAPTGGRGNGSNTGHGRNGSSGTYPSANINMDNFPRKVILHPQKGRPDERAIAGQKGKLFVEEKLLKPMRERDETEKKFYERWQSTDLGKFIAPYHGTETRDGVEYIVLKNLFSDYKSPAKMDVKVGLPSNPSVPNKREGVANLLGCYVHGVDSSSLVYRNHVNGYEGKQCIVEHFDMIIKKFFKKMGPQPHLIKRMEDLIEALSGLKGVRFASASLLFAFEEDTDGKVTPSNVWLIDFERVKYTDSENPDEMVIRSIRHILHAMRLVWENAVFQTVYLVRHGERYDYTDMDWAPKATHPHDSPLSPVGDSQADDIADRLAIAKPYMVVSSPFQRAIKTAEPLARRLHTTLCVEPGLAEFLCNKTRKRVPNFISEAVSVSPWVDTEYVPYWPELCLETWDIMCQRVRKTVRHLLKLCEGKGDLIIVSHRSTLQAVMDELTPTFGRDTKLEYGGIAMVVQDTKGELVVQSWNELNHLRHRIASPSSNPYRHIEGYYQDMDWGLYKSTSTR